MTTTITGSPTFIDRVSEGPCLASEQIDEQQADEEQVGENHGATDNPVRRSGRFVVESVQYVRTYSTRSCDAYTADDDDYMWEAEQSPPQRFLQRAMSKRQARLKSILKNARSASFCQPSSNETSPPPTRRKRVSFSEIVTKQLYKSDDSQTESRRGKDKQKKKNKNQSDSPSKKTRQTPPSKNGRPLNEQRKQPESLLESLSSFFHLSSAKEDYESIEDESVEVEWNEVIHRRRRNLMKPMLKKCDSELSDESGFGSLPSSFDEENNAIDEFCDDAVFSSIKTDESNMPHEDDKYQDLNVLIQQMLNFTISNEDTVSGND